LGLGLAIARHLVEIHGGTIHAESPGEGKGTTLTLRLPLIRSTGKLRAELKRQRESQEHLEPQSPLKGVHVLLVDDDQDTLELLSAALRQRQATVTAVSSAREAIAAIRTSHPDVLVSDIAMPGEDGYGLIQRVRAMDLDHGKAIPAVAITAYAKEEDRQRAFSSGYQHYLSKPVELSELVSAVADAARRD
jgi:CheY-like chemotaxis protein